MAAAATDDDVVDGGVVDGGAVDSATYSGAGRGCGCGRVRGDGVTPAVDATADDDVE